MKKLLVQFGTNWADEMDIEGFKVYKESDWEIVVNKLISYKKSITVGFGTNQDNEYENGSELLLEYHTNYVTDEQVKVLDDLFGGEYGQFEDPLEIIDQQDEDEDEEDED